MEEERLKYREIEDHQGGWRESITTGTDGRERPDGSQGRSREKDRHSRRAEGKRKGDGERSREADELSEVETSSVQVGEGTGSRRVLNWLDKDYEVVMH